MFSGRMTTGRYAFLLRFLCLLLPLLAAANLMAAPKTWTVYIGTYTTGASKGIYQAQFDAQTGKLSDPELAAETKNPSFLALHPDGRHLYAVGEINSFGGQKTGAVSAFGIEANTGRLEALGQQSSGGGGPCHVAVDRSGRCVMVANYGSGSIAALPIEPKGGLGAPAGIVQHEGASVNPRRQAGPHAHQIVPDPANRLALVCDLGLDKVLFYRLEPRPARLVAGDPPSVSLPPGAGPRHLAFHPKGKFVYVISELNSTITACRYQAKPGTLEPVQTVSTLPEEFRGENTCAEIQVHPSGKFVCGSNRGHDSLAMFAADSRSGRLTLLQHQSSGGKTPRFFDFDPSGRWLLAANQGSDNVAVFAVEPQTGRLTPTGQSITVGAPVCVVFRPAS